MNVIIGNIKNWFKNFKFTPAFAVKCAVALFVLAYYIMLFFAKSTSTFFRSLDIFNDAGDPNKIIRIISYVIFFLSLSWIVRFLIKQLSAPVKKGKAIIDMLCSLIKYAAVIVLLFFILKACGVDPTTILAGIGILGLVVGLEIGRAHV